MESERIMSASRGVLVLVDYQERLMPAIADRESVLERAVFLAEVAGQVDVPVIGTAQNPGKLGRNVADIDRACEVTVDKQHFGACAQGLIPEVEQRVGKKAHVVIAGCEAHVCLMQSALGLLDAGLRVFVVADACGSRYESDRVLAMQRLAAAGATVVSAEMVAFEWLATSEHPRFRDVSGKIKERA